MSVIVRTRKLDDVVILDLNGRLTIGEGTQTIRETIRALMQSDYRKFLINLGGVDYIDSSGLGELVRCFTTVRKETGGQMKLLNLTRRVHDLLQITKLLTVFEAFDNETEAVKSML